MLQGALSEPRVQCLVWGHQRGKLDLLGLEANSCGVGETSCLWIWLNPRSLYVGNHCTQPLIVTYFKITGSI